MPLYGTLSLFRTSFAGCYAFPRISLGCDVSTCKPYGYVLLLATQYDKEPGGAWFEAMLSAINYIYIFFKSKVRKFLRVAGYLNTNNSTTTPKNHTDIYDSSKKMKNETKRHESRDR